jgi:predicted anti-sigma-YlaC factor YlaD
VREDCDRFRVAALLRPDGELSALELQRQQAHAARCRDCRAYAAEIARITACIRATPPQRLERRVVVRGHPERTPLVRAMAALAIGVVIAAGIGETKRSATAAPHTPAVAGTAGTRKAI